MVSIVEKIDCGPQTLHEWMKKTEVDNGKCADVQTEFAEKVQWPLISTAESW